MRSISWNVNGIRAVKRNGGLDWLAASGADLISLQEVKASPQQVDDSALTENGYEAYWHPAEKPGYSGVLTYTRLKPQDVQIGLGDPSIDREGRVIALEFPECWLINTYFPNSQRNHERLPFKLAFCRAILEFCESKRKQGKGVILCGDYNIAHHEIDLANPKANQNNAGFLPDERAWMDTLTSSGYVDCFRVFNQQGGYYTWWSYRANSRNRNVGWRLDYHCVNRDFQKKVQAAWHESGVRGSDHCPVLLETN